VCCVAACGDEGGGAVVSDTISWKVGGQGVHAGHTQANVDQNFSVSCSRTASGLTVIIKDPGFKGSSSGGVAGAPRPAGSIEIRNYNPTNNSCNVTVTETEQGTATISYLGTCGTVCSLTGQYNYMGWDFSGQLRCSGLTRPGDAAMLKYTLGTAADTNIPVEISVDNCG
jgi:hypothetical protein